MAVTRTVLKCARRFDSERATKTTPASKRGQKVYAVVCSDRADGPDTALASTGLPAANAAWSTAEPDVKSRRREAVEDPDAAGYVFDVTIDYDDQKEEPSGSSDNPVDEPQEVEFGFTEFTETTYMAEEVPETVLLSDGSTTSIGEWPWGKAIMNSAGFPPLNSIEKVFYDAVIIIDRNEADWDLAKQIDYQDSINSDEFTITYRGRTYTVTPGQARLSMISVKGTFAKGVAYFKAHYEMQVRKDGWLRNVEDRGLVEIVDGVSRQISEGTGQPALESYALDGTGKKETSNVRRFIQYQLHKKRAFGDLTFGS